MDAKHMDALRELEIAALRGHPDGYATSDCTVTYKEAADALRAALARIHELETALREYREKLVLLTADADAAIRWVRVSGDESAAAYNQLSRSISDSRAFTRQQMEATDVR